MIRILPMLLVPLIVAAAWRRDALVLKIGPRTPEVRKPQVAHPMRIECEDAVTEAPATVVPVPSGLLIPADGKERERQLQLRVAKLEEELRVALVKVDEHRAKLAQALNRRGPDPLKFLTYALSSSQERVMELEAQLEVLEAAHVERAIASFRTD